jgi:aminoglycoside phosphotransferase family enzyme/predicted kinase
VNGEHRVDSGSTTDALERQRRIVAALCDPRSYPHPVAAVRLVETHISFVLLTGQYAYKLKKPLALGFLDFSTLAARRFYCTEELRLNGRLAPRLYLDVVAITGEPDRPRLGGTGPVLDYAVRMVEFPQSALLDAMLARGALSSELVDALAGAVARFHAAIDRAPAASPFGDPAHVHAPMRQNFEQLAPLIDDAADRATLDALRAWSERERGRLEPAFAARRDGGFVRECHGDLHVGNIALIDGELQIFDGIEFNANLRWIDVISEIAFLTMDLRERGQPALAARLLDAYLQATGDYAGLRVLRYYLVYRALVRAKVARLRAGQEPADDPDRAAELAVCRDYLGVATRLAAPRPVALVVTHGVPGAGKTFRTQQLLEALDALRVRSDVERRRMFGTAGALGGIAPRTGDAYGEAATQQVYARLEQLAHSVLDAGYPVIVDATFPLRRQRDAFRRLAEARGIPFCLIDCEAPADRLRERVAARARTGHDASEATVAVVDRQLREREPPAADELARAVVVVDDAGEQPEELARRVREKLGWAGD